jgi:hypothetical protein
MSSSRLGRRSRRCPLQPQAEGLGDVVSARDGASGQVGQGPGDPEDNELAEVVTTRPTELPDIPFGRSLSHIGRVARPPWPNMARPHVIPHE